MTPLPIDDYYLRACARLLPTMRHEVRGRLNTAMLYLEVARRALARGDEAKAQGALDRAHAENRRLSEELPEMLTWIDPEGLPEELTVGSFFGQLSPLFEAACRRCEVDGRPFALALDQEQGVSGAAAREAVVLLMHLLEKSAAEGRAQEKCELPRITCVLRADTAGCRLEVETDPAVTLQPRDPPLSAFEASKDRLRISPGLTTLVLQA